ncbi:hypothetical protein D917_06426 [Trichinella nativa]|uniref:Uncharacterized protein n=1 Tax=Trichinella nativa TaxID=6335 RepID=A0A1Y3EW75_9BILA|nr:hypothetical protein D917_06426 [Trichinella nativa]
MDGIVEKTIIAIQILFKKADNFSEIYQLLTFQIFILFCKWKELEELLQCPAVVVY